jgi:hypothetical protein
MDVSVVLQLFVLEIQQVSSISGVFPSNFPTLTTAGVTRENYEMYLLATSKHTLKNQQIT